VVPGSWLRLTVGFGAGLVLVGLQAAITGLAGHIHWIRAPEIEFSAASIALAGFLLLASREEMAFRGYPLRRLAEIFGPCPALLLMASIFALEHLAGGYSWTNAWFGAAVGALMFGMAALATRGLAVPIGIHAAWNFGQWALGNTEFAGLWKRVLEPGFEDRVGRIEMISYVVVMMLATLAFWCLCQRRKSGLADKQADSCRFGSPP
jgi:membrane protease YdiL (CAAX protease family)